VIILDTTVLVYAVGNPHPLAAPSREIISAVRDGLLSAHTTPEVIQEFAHVRAKRRDRADAVTISQAYSTILGPLQLVNVHHLNDGLNLWESTPQLGAFDSVLASLAIALDATLISADRAFGDVPALRWHNLADGLEGIDGKVGSWK
jgi:predicted nucleic acid-binding protein